MFVVLKKNLLFSKPKTQHIKYFLHGFNVYTEVYGVNQGKIMLWNIGILQRIFHDFAKFKAIDSFWIATIIYWFDYFTYSITVFEHLYTGQFFKYNPSFFPGLQW